MAITDNFFCASTACDHVPDAREMAEKPLSKCRLFMATHFIRERKQPGDYAR
jgi:hypothetical protein